MEILGKIAALLRHESSLICVLLLATGIITFLRDPQSPVPVGIFMTAVFIVLLAFFTNSLRENYEKVINQKDEMIKMLTRERKSEIKHLDDMRKQFEGRATNGWVTSNPESENS